VTEDEWIDKILSSYFGKVEMVGASAYRFSFSERMSPMAISHISVISIPVKDQEAAKQFYTDVLGFSVTNDSTFDGGMRWIQLGIAEAATQITLVTWFPSMPAGSQQGLVFEVDDLEATIAHLQANGVDVPALESAPWGSWVTINDPDGNGLVIQKSTAMG
jgi:predicted enzyme related to lactoylglutathione lyase